MLTKERIRRFLVCIMVMFIFFSLCGCGQQGNDGNIDNDEKPLPEELPKYGVFIGVDSDRLDVFADYDIVVIDAAYYTKEEIAQIHQKGTKVYSYLNIGSLEDFRDFYLDFKHLTLSIYDDWPGEYWIDVSDAGWQQHMYTEAGLLVEKGVDGFFIDNADVYYQYPTDKIFQGVVTILNRLNEYGKDLIINGGDVFVTKAVIEPDSPVVKITGVNQECVFTNIDFDNEKLITQSEEDTKYYQEYLELVVEKGLVVYLLEYSSDDSLLPKIIEYCDIHKFNYYVSSSIDLQ